MRGKVDIDGLINAVTELHSKYGIGTPIPLKALQEYPQFSVSTLRDTLAMSYPGTQFEQQPSVVTAAMRCACIKAMRESPNKVLDEQFVEHWVGMGCKTKVMRMWAQQNGKVISLRKPKRQTDDSAVARAVALLDEAAFPKDRVDVTVLYAFAADHGIGQKAIYRAYRQRGGKVVWNAADSIMARLTALESRVQSLCEQLGVK